MGSPVDSNRAQLVQVPWGPSQQVRGIGTPHPSPGWWACLPWSSQVSWGVKATA